MMIHSIPLCVNDFHRTEKRDFAPYADWAGWGELMLVKTEVIGRKSMIHIDLKRRGYLDPFIRLFAYLMDIKCFSGLGRQASRPEIRR